MRYGLRSGRVPDSITDLMSEHWKAAGIPNQESQTGSGQDCVYRSERVSINIKSLAMVFGAIESARRGARVEIAELLQ